MQRPNANPLVFELDVLDEHVHALQEDKPIASFGLDALNSILGGVYPGLNYAIGTAPGKGKTTLALQEADKLAADGHPVIAPRSPPISASPARSTPWSSPTSSGW